MEKSRSCSRSRGSDDYGRVANVDKCVISLFQDGKSTGQGKLIEGNFAILLLVNSILPTGQGKLIEGNFVISCRLQMLKASS
ncbi:hypothetical protein FF2_027821 [Malus domestica]